MWPWTIMHLSLNPSFLFHNMGALAGVAQLLGASSCKPKGHRFHSWSGHRSRLWVKSPFRARMRGTQLVFLSPSLSLPSPLSKINKHVLGWGLKKWEWSQWCNLILLHLFVKKMNWYKMWKNFVNYQALFKLHSFLKLFQKENWELLFAKVKSENTPDNL